MDRRSFIKAGSGAAGLGFLSGCTSITGGGGSSDPIKIGALEPLSGGFTPWGTSHRAGLEFAIDEINDDGGVNGRNLELVIEDTKSNPTEADSIFRRLSEQEDIVAATGPVSSDVGIRTARTAEDLEIPLMLHMSGSDKVLTKDARYTFRVGLIPAPTTTRAQAQLVENAGYDRVGAIVADYAWGQAVKLGIEKHFPVDVNIQTAPLGTDDFKPFIRKMPNDLQMMVATGHPPGTFTIAGQQFELGYQPEVTSGPGIPPATVFGALGQKATQGMTHFHMTDIYSQKFRDVAARYAEKNGKRMDTHEGYGYVTGKLLAQAITDAGPEDSTAIADTIRNIEFDSLFANPIEYTEWGELKNQRQIYSQFETGAPEYYPDGKWRLVEQFRTDPLQPYEPGN